jgi:hypothetical protein
LIAGVIGMRAAEERARVQIVDQESRG